MQPDDERDARQPAPSKSQLKRDALALQQLGVALLEISESDWTALGLPERLVAALREARHIHAHGARKRQLQYIGKLMREIDPQPIRRHLDQLQQRAREQARLLHRLESWRERLVEGGDQAVEAYLADHAQADRQQLRQLVRQARKEQGAGRPPAASRALFRYLRETTEAETAAGRAESADKEP